MARQGDKKSYERWGFFCPSCEQEIKVKPSSSTHTVPTHGDGTCIAIGVKKLVRKRVRVEVDLGKPGGDYTAKVTAHARMDGNGIQIDSIEVDPLVKGSTATIEKTRRRHLTLDDTLRFAEGQEFRPEWASLWTVEKMEEECAPFKFKGPGWYIQKGPMGSDREGKLYRTLVMPTSSPDIFLFCAYNENDPGLALNWMVNAPVRVDER